MDRFIVYSLSLFGNIILAFLLVYEPATVYGYGFMLLFSFTIIVPITILSVVQPNHRFLIAFSKVIARGIKPNIAGYISITLGFWITAYALATIGFHALIAVNLLNILLYYCYLLPKYRD